MDCGGDLLILDYRVSALAPALKLLCGSTWRDRQSVHLIGTLTPSASPFQTATTCHGLVDKGRLRDALYLPSHQYGKDPAPVHEMYSSPYSSSEF